MEDVSFDRLQRLLAIGKDLAGVGSGIVARPCDLWTLRDGGVERLAFEFCDPAGRDQRGPRHLNRLGRAGGRCGLFQGVPLSGLGRQPRIGNARQRAFVLDASCGSDPWFCRVKALDWNTVLDRLATSSLEAPI